MSTARAGLEHSASDKRADGSGSANGAITPMASDWRPRLRALLPLYVAMWAAATCAVLGMGSVVDDPRFTTTVLTLLSAGFAVSLLLRIAGIRRSATPVLLALVGLGLAGLLRLHQYGFVVPGAQSIVISVLPALLLTWFLAIYSFCLIADDLLLFVIPPSLAVLGLTGTENPNADMTAYFLVFMVAAIFGISYQNHLRYLSPEQAGRSPRRLRQLLTWQMVTTAVLFTAVAVLTGLVAVPLRDSGSVGLYRFRIRANSLLGAFGDMGLAGMGRELQMGLGGAALSDRVLFRVQAPTGLSWRARTYDQYTGRGWVDGSGRMPLNRESQPGGWWEAVLLPPGALSPTERAQRRSVTQRFTLVASTQSRTLVAAADPALVRFDDDPGPLQLSSTGVVRLVSLPYLPAGMSYEVVSYVLTTPPRRLRRVKDPDPDELALKPYLSVPTSVSVLRPEVERLVQGLENNYDRARAIERWLGTHCTYNLNVPPVPTDQDVVVHFLHTAREGYCDLFASAMVVMCRLAGIPARLAAGFAPSEERDPNTGELLIRERDAHAWVEVFFPGCGWVEFDPTPPAEATTRTPFWQGGVASSLSRLARSIRFPVVLLLAAGLLAINLARLTLYEPWRRRQTLLRSTGDGPRGRVLRAYFLMTAALERLAARQPGQTAAEYSRVLRERWPDAAWHDDVEALTRAFTAARFGREPVTEAQAQAAQAQLARVRAAVRHRNGRKRHHGAAPGSH